MKSFSRSLKKIQKHLCLNCTKLKVGVFILLGFVLMIQFRGNAAAADMHVSAAQARLDISRLLGCVNAHECICTPMWFGGAIGIRTNAHEKVVRVELNPVIINDADQPDKRGRRALKLVSHYFLPRWRGLDRWVDAMLADLDETDGVGSKWGIRVDGVRIFAQGIRPSGTNSAFLIVVMTTEDYRDVFWELFG